MDTPSAPAAPDPKATAAAQAAMNKETAVAQYGLNATNQNTPQGSLNYTQVGKWDDGTPRFQADTTLSAPEQQIFNTNQQTRQNIGTIGSEQSKRIGALLNEPINLNTATEDKITQLGAARLDPRFARESSALEADLLNRGIRPGTEAYNNARTQFDQSKNDAYNQLYLTGRGQGAQEALTQRNQPINEISALMSGSQVSQPNFQSTPTPGVAPTDYLGAVNQNLAQQNVGYQAEVGNQRGLMSGLFGLGSAGLGGWAYGGFKGSDVRLKDDIVRVGKTDGGLPIYIYRYKDSPVFEMGVMAQDVERVIPEAVRTRPDGMKAVHYGMIR